METLSGIFKKIATYQRGEKKNIRLARNADGLKDLLGISFLALAGWINYLETTPPNSIVASPLPNGDDAIGTNNLMRPRLFVKLAEMGLKAIDSLNLNIGELGAFVGCIAYDAIQRMQLEGYSNAEASLVSKEFHSVWCDFVVKTANDSHRIMLQTNLLRQLPTAVERGDWKLKLAQKQEIDRETFLSLVGKRHRVYIQLVEEIFAQLDDPKKRTDADVKLILTLMENCRLDKTPQPGVPDMATVVSQTPYIDLLINWIRKYSEIFAEHRLQSNRNRSRG